MEKRRNENLNRCEAALNSEWSTVVKEARWILHKILFYISWTNWEVWVLLFLLVFLHQGCRIRWTAWTACIWRRTSWFCKPHLRTEQRTLAGPLQVFKKRLIRRHVDVSQSLWLKVNHWVSPGTPRRKLRATKCWGTASRDVKATGSTMSGR